MKQLRFSILLTGLAAAAFAFAPAAEKKSPPPEMPSGYQRVQTDTTGWFPFSFPTDDTNLDSIDLSGFLDAPAGKHGFVTVKPDGHFYFEDGTRARFFGTDVGGKQCAPDKEKAPAIAARLAKYGVNMLRLHAFDGQWGPMIDPKAPTSQELVPETLDRMDFFINELKKRGIYVYMDLLDYRQFRTADGVAHGDEFTHNWAGSMKGASIFDERMIALQKDYATKLLTHKNAYTGLRYAEDPGIGVVETTNENSVFYFFRQADMSHPYYREELAKRWNTWLAARYPDRAKLAAAWGEKALRPEEDPAKGNVALPFGMANNLRPEGSGKQDPMTARGRISDLFRFFVEIQRHYYTEMRGHLKKIGVRMPVAGTNQSFFQADSQVEAELNDWVSRNQYWNHPNVNAKPLLKFFNGAMVRADIPTVRNPISDIVGTSVHGKPQGVAEYNFPWPNEYRCEGWIMSAAYACLQDWDMFLLFNYDPEAVRLGNFTSNSDPARWGEYPAIATMFHRRDVAPGKTEVLVVHNTEDTYTPRPDGRYAKSLNERYLTFMTKTRNVFTDEPVEAGKDAVALACGASSKAEVKGRAIRLPELPWEEWLFPKFVAEARKLGLPGYDAMDPAAKRLDSDTGELSLDYGAGLLRINTPCTKGAVGYLNAAGPIQLGAELSLECSTPFAAVTATSLDGKPLGASRRVLLTAVARAEHTGQAYWRLPDAELAKNPMSWMLPEPGSLPVISEPVRARMRLAMPGNAAVYPLDPSGKRQAKMEVKMEDGKLVLDPAASKSIWCEILAE